MSNPAAPSKRTASREHYQLEVNAYDRASSLLIALLVMFGVLFVALVIMFFARRMVTIQAPIEIRPFDPSERPAEAMMGLQNDPDPPGIEDAPELTEPALMDTLNALAAVSDKVAILSDEQLDGDNTTGKGSGVGDNRASGGGGAPEPRREIKFEFADISNYARWYDHFKIELAAMSQFSSTVYYASRLSNTKPTVRTGDRSAEQRYVFPANEGPFYAFDRKLAEKAGIASKGEFLLQCFPTEAEGLLLGKEQQQARAAGKKIGDIKRTVFKVVASGGGFDFVVEEQLYY